MTVTAITPKLVVRDADAALDFYTRALGAQVTERYDLAGSVVFSVIEVGGLTIQVKEGDGTDPAPEPGSRPGVLIDLVVDDPDAVAQAFLDQGGSLVFPVADQPYGSRQGRVRDPFDHEWLVGTSSSMSPEEIRQALDTMT